MSNPRYVSGLMMRLALLLVLQGQTPLTVGPVTARPGEAASGWLDVPAAADAGTRIPITIVRGRLPGPTLGLVAGTHGSEVAPIVGLQRVPTTRRSTAKI